MKHAFSLSTMIIACLCCLPYFSNAQNSFSVHAGINSSKILLDEYGSVIDRKIGLHLGAGYRIEIGEKMVIEPHVRYSSKGCSPEFLSEDINLHYLDLLVLPKYEVVNNLFVELGPQIGYLINSSDDPASLFSSSDFEAFAFGFVAGVQYRFLKSFSIQIRFNQGFEKILDRQKFNLNGEFIGTERDGQNQNIELGFSYYFASSAE